MPRPAPPAHRRAVGRLLLSVVLLAAAVLAVLFRDQLLDAYYVRTFQPSPAIAAISQRASFSDKGEYLFFASRPELLAREAFNTACRSAASERTAILGCYSLRRIYLYDIDNQKLEGVKEVTAAHEMLHAAYERLSRDEKGRVNALLESQQLGEHQDRIDKLMAEYEKTEPGQRYNELHSILGSEVRNLSPELETYFGSYFDDRDRLVTLSERYQTVFGELESRQNALVAELNDLADRIDSLSAAYRRDLEALNAEINAFNRRAGSGDMTREEYESSKAGLESKQRLLRADYDEIQALIESYEQKRAELAAINSEAGALNRSINSSVPPQTEGIDG